eukprot:TRINITY_DN19957_c0_g1_i1.p1 TRINITY_DN19957_c0_g1~~TRINITY_DN19957_c0_g1_i1.p1  ORF type:complete len:377 (+),score=87.59 TRINITY_DN19957_c0_g1_i1:50-1180(+)
MHGHSQTKHMARSFLVVIAAAIFIAGSATAQISPVDYPCNGTMIGDTLTVHWKLDEAAQTINFALVAKTTGWIGIGTGPNKDMKGADIIMAKVTNGVLEIVDYYAKGNERPIRDNQQDFSATSGQEVDGITTVKFTRKLNTGDSDDEDLTNKLDSANFIAAFHPTSDNLAQVHKGTGKAQVSLKGCQIIPQSKDKLDDEEIHGMLMLIGWGFLVPVAIILARFFKSIGHLWYQLHVALLLVAYGLIIAGFAVIVDSKGGEMEFEMGAEGAHVVCGIISFIFLLVQPAIGFYADHVYDPKRTEVPLWPDKVHAYIGRTAFLLATITICIGLKLIGGSAAWYISYAVVSGLFIVAFVGLTVTAMSGVNPDKDKEMQGH